MVTAKDAELILSLFGHRSAVSGRTRALRFVQWDKAKPWSVFNCIPLTTKECKMHNAGGLGMYHSAFRCHVDRTLGSIPVDQVSFQIKHDDFAPDWKDCIVDEHRRGVPFAPLNSRGKGHEKAWMQQHKTWCDAHFEGWDCSGLLM